MKQKKKMMMFGIVVMIIIFGVINTHGERRMKDEVITITQECSNIGYDYIRDIYSQDNRVCLECLHIDSYDGRTLVGNQITVCSRYDDFYWA